METFADGPHGDKVQNVCSINNKANAGSKQFPPIQYPGKIKIMRRKENKI